MADKARQHGVTPHILDEVIKINNKMPSFFVEKIKTLVKNDKNIGILGLSFKPESDDVRDSAAAKIIGLLIKEGFTKIYAYDPVANKNFDALYQFQEVKYMTSKEELCNTGDVIVLITAWIEFKNLRREFPDKNWVDCRYFLEENDTSGGFQ
jgi:UDPglucose 6-dehydrogenase